MKSIHKPLLLVVCLLSASLFSMAQKPTKKEIKRAEIQRSIDSQLYVFHAQQAMSMGGGTRQLTSEYDMRVKPDSITTYLPYFGRAYEVPYGSTDLGLKILTQKFSYQKTVGKKGGWEITIKPTERMDVQQLYLTVSQDGYATLQVTSLNRQPISFSGYVSKVEQ